MVDIPDPLPGDIDALHKLARELQDDIRGRRKRLRQMQDLIEVLEDLVETEDDGSTEAE